METEAAAARPWLGLGETQAELEGAGLSRRTETSPQTRKERNSVRGGG